MKTHSPLATSLIKLREATTTLNRLTDEINDSFRNVEKWLQECSLGIPVAVEVGSIGDQDYRVAFTQADRMWRVGIFQRSSAHQDNAWSFRPWENYPREIKLEAIKVLPQLVEKLLEEATSRISNAEAAVGNINSVPELLCAAAA